MSKFDNEHETQYMLANKCEVKSSHKSTFWSNLLEFEFIAQHITLLIH